MKFQNPVAFEKHLKQSLPGQHSRFFLLMTSSEEEKRAWIQLVIDCLEKKEQGIKKITFFIPEVSLEEVVHEVLSPSFWKEERVIILEGIDKSKNLETFFDLCRHKLHDCTLIFCATSSKNVTQFYQKWKKEMVVLDVCDEKPWEREKRIQAWAVQEASKLGKRLTPEKAAYLMTRIGHQTSFLLQELQKVATYVGDQESIEQTDIDAVCGSYDSTTGWQMAESLVWTGPISLRDKIADLSFVFPFIGQIRYQLQLGAQIAEMHLQKLSTLDLQKEFPSLRPQQLQKYVDKVVKRPFSFFIQGLKALYELELRLKSSTLDPQVAFDLFQANLYSTLNEKTVSTA